MEEKDNAGTVAPVADTVPAEERIIIDAPGRKASFRGHLLKEVESRIEDWQVRYTVIRVYAVTDELLPYKYVISSIGRSVVYHKHGSTCGMGTEHQVWELDDLPYFNRLAECPRCKPLPIEIMADNDLIDLETDRVNPLKKCKDAHDLWMRLHEARIDEDTGEKILYLSAPAERLLEQLALVDDDIRAERERVGDLDDV